MVDRLGAWRGPRAAVLAAVEQLEPTTIDYPEEGSIFPPEITAPAFFRRDGAERAKRWQRLAAGLRAKIALYVARAATGKTQ